MYLRFDELVLIIFVSKFMQCKILGRLVHVLGVVVAFVRWQNEATFGATIDDVGANLKYIITVGEHPTQQRLEQ